MDLLKILDGTPEPPVIDLQLLRVNTSGDYLLATPMYEFQKELTDQIVSLHYSDILKYYETDDTRDVIVKLLQICIDNCMLVSTHPYLLISHYMPKNLLQKDMPLKLAETSGKFSVLKDLVDVLILLGKHPANVAVVMKNDPRFFDLTEALLLGCKGNRVVRRYNGHNVQRELKKQAAKAESGTHTTIHLLPHDGALQRGADTVAAVHFDTVVVLDAYVDTDTSYFQNLLTQNHTGDKAVVVRLVPMKTVEHCKLYYRERANQPDYLYKLISSIVCLREFIGNLPPDVFPIYNQKLRYLADKFFDCESPCGWPLPDLPPIPAFSSADVERSLLTEVHFHYTPYDSIDFSEEQPVQAKPTYYETRRLELEYITNPLKNDFDVQAGVRNLLENKAIVLTHRVIMQLTAALRNRDLAERELASYAGHGENDNREVRLDRVLGETLARIVGDIDHAQARIDAGNKRIARKHAEVETIDNEIDVAAQELKRRRIEIETAKNENGENGTVKKENENETVEKENGIEVKEENETVKKEDETEVKEENETVKKENATEEGEIGIVKKENDTGTVKEDAGVENDKNRDISEAAKNNEAAKSENGVDNGSNNDDINGSDGGADTSGKSLPVESSLYQYLANQDEIWELQSKIKEQVARISAKHDEKNYVLLEYHKVLESIKTAETTLETARGETRSLSERIAAAEELEQSEAAAYSAHRERLLDAIRAEKEKGAALRTKLGSTFLFLRNTVHLKKRKGRTPNK